ncbi:hypothetical protein LCGC14_0396220 [marine sediment metagenome]|uniref:Calcineurin-like phosphoesterase domain-containing protein n=1 Tax=marine sediment metagenome TaxID=412755 RepID=A0A0F9SY36_9ZZZZ
MTYRDSQRNYEDMIVTKDLVEFSKIYLVPLADWHIGATGVALGVISGYIDWIKQRPNAFTILNGDLMNCAGKTTSAELFDDLITPDTAYAQVRAMLLPIKDKIIMITRGNHEEMVFRQVGADYMMRLAYDLGDVPYRPNGGMFGIRLGKNNHRRVLWGYATHGWGGARTIGAKVNKVEELAKAVNVQCYILSHDHTQNVHRLNQKSPPRSRISFKRPIYQKTDRRILINTGGFIEYVGYVRRKGYSPQDMGTPRILAELKSTQKGNEDYHISLHASM